MTTDNIKLSDSDLNSTGGSKSKQSRLETLLPPSSSSSSLANTQNKYAAEDTAVVFSSQKSQFADYTTWKGIENKTGIEQKYAVTFLIKELLDNAFDYLEISATQQQHHHNNTAAAIQPEIHVIIEKNQGKYIRIAVSNPNYHDDLTIMTISRKQYFLGIY
jgi:hypothetical protein